MLAVVIPACSIRPTLCAMTARNARVWKELCDVLIIPEDGPYCEELVDIADHYMLHPVRLGVCNNANVGWTLALALGADYVCLMDSDVAWAEGSLRDMCVPGKVTVPTINSTPDTAFTAPMLCVPRTISDEFGLYDDAGGPHKNESFDGVYYQRIRNNVEKIKHVKVDHFGSATRFHRV